MATVHGKGAAVYYDGYDISSYLTRIAINPNLALAEDTAFGDSSESFIAGIRGGTIDFDGWFDSAAGASDAVLATALGSEVQVLMHYPGGDAAIGERGYATAGTQSDDVRTSEIGSAVALSGSITAEVGIESIESAHILSAETATGTDSTIDNGASSSNGAAGYIICSAYDSITSIDVKLEHSATGAFGGEEADLLTFTQITAANAAERVAATGTVNRYVRCSWTVAGSGSATFAVGFARL